MSEWRFLLDENVDPKTATYLQKAEVDADHVRDTLGQGADDEAEVHALCRNGSVRTATSDKPVSVSVLAEILVAVTFIVQGPLSIVQQTLGDCYSMISIVHSPGHILT